MSEILLAIDAATSSGGVAIGRDGVALAEVCIADTRRHSELLLPAIEFALHASGVQRSDLTGIVVGSGPGSFTGVRIAAATARGLAAGLGIPLFAYSSLAALAAVAARGSEPVCALFDARRGEVYAGCYAFPPGGLKTLLPPTVAQVEQVVQALDAHEAVFVGDGAEAYATQLSGERVAGPLVQPRASALLWLAHYDPAAGGVPLPASFEPGYVRPSAAERGLST